jgi:hypothetical protein
MKHSQAQKETGVVPDLRPSCGRLTPRWSGRVGDKVPSSYGGARAAQLNR